MNRPTAADVGAVAKTGDTMTGTLRNTAEIQVTSPNNYRMVYGKYGTFWRQDGQGLYLMFTNENDQYGSYNNIRPFYTNLATGSVILGGDVNIGGTLSLANYSAFDSRYSPKNLASPAPSGWEKDNSTGIITQWGIATRTAPGTRINFPATFPNACVNVQLTLIWRGSFYSDNIYAQNPDQAGFIYVANTDEVSAYYLAKGY
ncbi:gp53-like domain-containing protein [Kosakonia quasisacchari]|uniref:phage tail fiber protein n=1 Tax=Kosakonia quasisacchari TaxID=2529380 RepID=UPI0039DFEEEF